MIELNSFSIVWVFFDCLSPGQFGEVFRAHYCPDGCVEESVTVAVKKTKDDCPEKEKESLLQEMAVMSKMVHPNIVKLYGVVTEGEHVGRSACSGEKIGEN